MQDIKIVLTDMGSWGGETAFKLTPIRKYKMLTTKLLNK